MLDKTLVKIGLGLCIVVFIAGCSGGDRTVFGKSREDRIADNREGLEQGLREDGRIAADGSIFDLFANNEDPNVTVEVNRYIWNATLEVLNFMPIEAADPFSGIIDFGYGTPPGGRRAYSGTVLVNDPALDARSLTVSLRTRGGPVNAETQRQVEDAILTRARQLRIRDSKL